MSLTSISLGNFYTTTDGKNVLGDTAGTGLDTQSLINSLTAASEVQATQDQTQITSNNAKTSALTQLQSLVTTFQSAAAALSNPPGINNLSSNVFAFANATVGNGGSTYVTATAAAGAAAGTYNISAITSLASSASQSSGVFNITNADSDVTTSDSGSYFTPGTVTFASGATLTVTAGDSLNTIAGNFNAISGKTGISATVIQVAASQYKLSFSATNTGTDANFNLTTSPTISSGESVLTEAGLGSAHAGTNAVFDLNGTQITRQSNSVSDAITNVTFNLQELTPDGTTKYPVTVSPDTTSVSNAITSFVNSYNSLQAFAAQQTQLNSSGTFVSSAVLASDPTFESIINAVDQKVDSEVAGIQGSNPSNLSQIGITFTNQAATGSNPAVTNLLSINSSTLNSALSSNFTGVQNVFGLNSTSSNANFALYSHTLPIGVTDFTVNIDPGSNTFTATYTQNGQSVSSNLTATATSGFSSGYTLTGAAGSALAGTTFLYVSTAAASINVHVSQGIADQSNTFANSALTTTTGSLAVALTGLQTSDTQLNKDITNVKTQANVYQQQLIAQFSALQQAINSSDTLLQSLSANENAQLETAS